MRCTQQQFNERMTLIKNRGYKPVQQKVWYHFKDGAMNFYPTTGKYFDEETKEHGLLKDLPDKVVTRYYNLDIRYLPEWVLDEKRQKWLKKFLQ